MKTSEYFKSTTVIGKCKLILAVGISIFFSIAIAPLTTVTAQPVLFDFDNAPLYTSLPINQTVGSITAHCSATGQGYSIQDANVLGFTPQGFAGHIIYPNSINLADLLISFNQALTGFSIMYACQELGCDDAATMRVTAYMGGTWVGTSTRTATFPGTWPVDTLSCSFPQGFDSVVVHYDSPPPLCQDYGVIYMADNMTVIALNNSTQYNEPFIEELIIPNPVSASAAISFSLLHDENIRININDLSGRLVKNLFDGHLNAGKHQLNWNVNSDVVECGMYFLNFSCEHFSQSRLIVVLK